MRVPESAMYLVVEVYDRAVCNTHYASSMQEATKRANELLEDHIKSIGYGCERDLKNGCGKGSDWQKAAADNLNAWCNWGDYNWDAHIISL